MRAGREILLTALTAITVWVALWCWHSFTVGMSQALLPLTIAGVLVAASGAALRIAHAPRPVTVLVQLALAWSVVGIRLAHSPIPVRGAARLRLEDAFIDAGNAAQRYAPPVPVVHGILPFLLCAAALAFVAADLLARTLRRPALIGLVLLAVFAVPFSIVGGGVSPWVFALTAAGFLILVVGEESGRVTRWGRPLDSPESFDAPARPAWRAGLGAAAVGTTATALALVLPLGIPTLHLDLSGIGGGAGNGHVTVTNPMVDLRRDLVQGRNVPLLEVTTHDPDPSYLRIAVLTRFTSSQWTAGDRSIPSGQSASGSVPLPGVDPSLGRADYDYQITAESAFDSHWLPTPAPISHIDAAGDWRYDTDTMDFIAARKGLTTAGLTYTATKEQLDLSSADLLVSGVGVGQVPALYTELPANLPGLVSRLAKEVTSSATTPFEKAVALQDWFRGSGGFHYSTATSLGSGTDDLVRFLTKGKGGRTGYCQQFAAAMAVMARSLGIPSRVAVGFLTPQRRADGTLVYSSHDMHAWPELYFAGEGWVRFEPTPAVRGTATPSYTRNLDVATPDVTTGGSTSERHTNRPSASAKPEVTKRQPTPTHTATTHHASHHTLWWLLVLVVVLLAGAALTLPATLRRRRRARRLGGDAEDAWSEVRDTAIDLRLPWAEDVSPRASGRLLSTYVVTPEGKAALERLVLAVERSRYGRTPAVESVGEDARLVVAGLLDGMPRDLARRAAWWPRTALRRVAARPPTSREEDTRDHMNTTSP